MSRSNPSENLVSPATRFFEWDAANGKLHYYDKEAKENIDVKLPFKFLVLDRVAQIGGGVKRDGKYQGFWSNAVKDLKRQKFVVRSKAGIEGEGLYAQIKGTRGFKFTTGLYIGFYGEDKLLQIGYIKFKGSSLTAWIEFTKEHRKIEEGAFAITSKSEPKEGVGDDYFEPVFAHQAEVKPETEAAAVALDVRVQEYLKLYFFQQGSHASFNDVANEGTPEYSGQPDPNDRDPYADAPESDFAEPEDTNDIPW